MRGLRFEARAALLFAGLAVLPACRQAGPWGPVDLSTLPAEARAPRAAAQAESAGPLLLGPVQDTAAPIDAALPERVLQLEDVLRSVEAEFPVVVAALIEVELADARLESARGGFDTRLVGGGKVEALGDFGSQRMDFAVQQPLRTLGATLIGGYQLGVGDLAGYDGDNETNDGGEFRLGASLPLLRGRATDERRVAEWKAELALERASPRIVAKRLEAGLKAAESYWRWVAAGQRLAIIQQLLELAELRQNQVERSVELGKLPRIANTENEQGIVSRRSSLIKAERELQEAALRLSLFLRDGEGNPIVPRTLQLPDGFPDPLNPADVLVAGPEEALSRRPELQILDLERRRLLLDRDLARNAMLPKLDVGVFAAQDVGATDKSPDTRDEFELEILMQLDVPIQRREPRGRTREATAKLAKLEADLQFVRDTVVADVRSAEVQFEQAWLQLAQARRSVVLSETLAEAERTALGLGQSDLLRVNLREQQAAQAEAQLVDVLFACHRAQAKYRAVLGLPYDEYAPAEDPVDGGGAAADDRL